MKKNIEDMQIKKPKITSILRKDIAYNENPSIKSRILKEPKIENTKSEPTLVQTSISAPKKEFGSRFSSTPRVKIGQRPLRKTLLIVFLFTLLFGGLYWVVNIFEQANVEIKAKHQQFILDNQPLTASKEKDADIGFEIMIVSDTQYKDIVLTESENVSRKATGEVIVYNEYSTKAVTIAKNSYISDESGKNYLTDKALTIPGYTVSKTDKTKIIPGQAVVGITAFLPGVEYNGTPVNFKINAYKNTSKYTKIYAKAKTMLTGGAQGLIYTLSPDDKGKLHSQANSSFKDSLLKKVNAQVPDGYVLYDTALQFSYHLDEAFVSENPSAKVPLDGTVSTVIFPKEDLRIALIKSLLPKSLKKDILELELVGLEDLSFDFNQEINKDMQTVNFAFTGELNGNWHPDINILRTNLLSAKYESVTAIFADDPGIVSAHVKLFPPWQKTLPREASRININIE